MDNSNVVMCRWKWVGRPQSNSVCKSLEHRAQKWKINVTYWWWWWAWHGPQHIQHYFVAIFSGLYHVYAHITRTKLFANDSMMSWRFLARYTHLFASCFVGYCAIGKIYNSILEIRLRACAFLACYSKDKPAPYTFLLVFALVYSFGMTGITWHVAVMLLDFDPSPSPSPKNISLFIVGQKIFLLPVSKNWLIDIVYYLYQKIVIFASCDRNM